MAELKEIDAKVSEKYRIGYYGRNGVYVEGENGGTEKIFNDKPTCIENWNDAVVWAKKNVKV